MKLAKIEKVKYEDLKEFLESVKDEKIELFTSIYLADNVEVKNIKLFIDSHISMIEAFISNRSKRKRQRNYYIMPAFNRLHKFCLIIEKRLEDEKEYRKRLSTEESQKE